MITFTQAYLLCFIAALFPARLLIQPPQPAVARLLMAVVLAFLLLLVADLLVYVARSGRNRRG